MHMHGLCNSPSKDDVGRWFAKLNAGGHPGLVQTGYLDVNDEDSIVQAFRRYYLETSEAMGEEQKRAVAWSPVTAEHLLCKLGHMRKFLANVSR